MKDDKRSRDDLKEELNLLRRRVEELKEFEEKHREASEHLRKLYLTVEQSPVSVVITDRNGVIEYVNPRFMEITGYRLEEVIGQNPRVLKSGEHSDEFYRDLWNTILSGRVWKGEFHDRKKSGELYWEEASISPITDAHGEITHFIAVKEDITARKEAEDALHSSEDRYRALFADSPIGLLEYDFSALGAYLDELRAGGVTDFRAYLEKNPAELKACAARISVTDANKAAVELYEARDRSELLGDLGRIFAESSYETFREGLIIVASGGTEYETETRITTLGGSHRDVFMRLRIVRSGPDGHRAILATMDITRRRRAEAELEKSRELLREAERVAGLGYYVLDLKTGTWTNSWVVDEVFGIDSGYKRDIDGWLKLLHPDFREDVRDYFNNEVLKNHDKFDREYAIINQKTGEKRWVHGLGSLKFDESGKVVEMFGTVQDITDRRRAQSEAHREMETTKNLLRLSEATFRISDIDELMKNVVEIGRDILKVDLVMSYVWDVETMTMRPLAASGLDSAALPLFKTMTMKLDIVPLKEAMDSGKVLVDSKADGDGSLALQEGGICDWVKDPRIIALLPLVGKREYQGLIICVCNGNECDDHDCLSPRKRDLMQAVANQVSIALEEARHYRESLVTAMELSRKVETIETFSRISRAILSTLDVDAIMELTARTVQRIVSCDWLRIIDIDREAGEFKLTAGFGEYEAMRSIVMPFSSTSLTSVLDTRRPEYIPDLQKMNSPLGLERDLAAEGYRSVLRIPIIVKDEVAGVLGLMSRRVSAFKASDFATLEDLSYHVGVALANARLVKDLEEFSLGTIATLARTIDAKSPWTHGHSERVTRIALSIGVELGLSEDELKDLKVAGLLHDIGKIGTYEAILDKRGRLTDEEMSEIRKHPARGAEILGPIRQMRHLLPVIRGHHEFFDGAGYPDGLSGENIPLQARILSVADTVDAMSADRPYRKGLPRNKIIDELKRCSGTQFDPIVVRAYLDSLERRQEDPQDKSN